VAIIYEIAYELLLYYYSLLMAGEAISLQGFISEAEDTLNMSIYYIHSLTLQEFQFVQLVTWIYLYHFYYLIIILVFIIFYYEYRLKTIEHPNISKQPIISPQDHN
jgi:hypothetical protein